MKKSPIIIIFIVILLVLGYIVFSRTQKSNPNIPPTQNQTTNNLPAIPLAPSTVDTINWKTYKSDQYKIEFKYPEHWDIKTTNISGIVAFRSAELQKKIDDKDEAALASDRMYANNLTISNFTIDGSLVKSDADLINYLKKKTNNSDPAVKVKGQFIKDDNLFYSLEYYDLVSYGDKPSNTVVFKVGENYLEFIFGTATQQDVQNAILNSLQLIQE